MKLPAAVGERHTFNVKEDSRNLIFTEGSKVTVNDDARAVRRVVYWAKKKS